jgi:GDP-4-dehydro-6-deoxy-D-mannose reductase
MRALVTGAGGFVAAHLITRLEAEDWSVGRVVRGGRTGTGEDFALGAGETTDFERVLEAYAPDVVYHLAGRMSGSAQEIYAANVVLATNLLQAVANWRTPCPVILAGSAAEYGRVENSTVPVKEDDPCRPLTVYGVSKHAQTLAGLAQAQSGLPVVIARIFNPLGTGMPGNLALPNFAAQIVASEVLQVGDLDVERDFVDVAEVARVMMALASNGAAYGKVFNVCSGEGFRLRRLVEDMIRLSGRDVRIEVDPARLRPNDVRALIGSTARLREAAIEIKAPDMDRLLMTILADATAKGGQG